MRTPDNSPDSPDNYIAYKDEQRQRDEKRKTFQAANRVKDAAGSSSSDAQLSDLAAERTGSKPAPEDMVKANHELFREAADYAWADGIRAGSPITLAIASDPKDTPLPKDQYNHLASVEQATGNLVAASKTIPDGTPWAGGWLNSPPIPNPELADEFADVRPQDSPERKTVPSVWDKPSEMPEAVQDGTMLNGGWADSLPVPRTNARPSGDLTADAAAIRQQSDQQSNGNSAPSGDQSNNNGLRPGEKVIWLDGVVPDSGAPTSPPRSDPAAGPRSGSGQSGSPSTGSGSSTSSTEAGAGKGANGELQPGEEGILSGGAASEPSDATSSMRGDPFGGMPTTTIEQAPSTARGSVDGARQALPDVTPAAQASLSVPIAETAKTVPNTSGGQTSNGTVPPWQTEEKRPVLLWETNVPESAGIVKKILGVRGMTHKEYWAFRKELRHQPFIDPNLALKVAKKLYYGEESLVWAQEALQPPTLGGEIKEIFRGAPSGALKMVGSMEEGAGQLIHTTEPETVTKQKEAIVEALLSLKGKNEAEVEEVRQLILQMDDPYLASYLTGVFQDVVDGADVDEVRDRLAPFTKGMSGALIEQGARVQDYSKTVLTVPLNLEGSWGRSLGEAIGGAIPVIGAAAVAGPGASWLSGALGTVGSMSADARQHNADPEMQARVAWLGLPLALVANAPIADKLTKLPWLRKYADSWVDTLVLKPISNGLIGAGQTLGTNVLAQKVYDPARNLWNGVASSFATGAVVSGVEPGLKRAARLAITPVQRAVELHGMLNEMGARLKAVPPLADGSKNPRAIVEQKLKDTPAENVYFQADTFVSSLKNAGIDPWRFVLGLKGATLADLKAAVDAKGYIRLPTATFAMDLMGTKAGNVLRPSLSFEPGGMTVADIEALKRGLRTISPSDEAFGVKTPSGGSEAKAVPNEEQTRPIGSGKFLDSASPGAFVQPERTAPPQNGTIMEYRPPKPDPLNRVFGPVEERSPSAHVDPPPLNSPIGSASGAHLR